MDSIDRYEKGFKLAVKRKLMLLTIVLALASSSIVVFAAISVISNTVTTTPGQPVLTLAQSNSSPYLGETVTYTATLTSARAIGNVPVSFRFSNGTKINVNTNVGGVATLANTITSMTVYTVTANATCD